MHTHSSVRITAIGNGPSGKQVDATRSESVPFAFDEPLWRQVAAHRLPALVERLQDKEHVPRIQAERLVMDVKQFLYLCSIRRCDGSQPMTPPEPIDAAWHHFILFTGDHVKFCEAHFGRYMHHRPFTTSEKEINRANGEALKGIKATIALAKDAFGTLSHNWREHLLGATTLVNAEMGADKCAGSTNCQAPYRIN